MAMSRKLAKEHGVLVGISSGANMVAGKRLKKKFGRVVTVLPDGGDRYISMGLYG